MAVKKSEKKEKEVVSVKKTASKPAAKKTAVKKTEPKKAVKKAAKPAAKKASAKKATPKKTSAKKAKKVEYMSYQAYVDLIRYKKWEAHNKDWLYIEINSGDLLQEQEPGADNLETCCNAIMDCMLEGDFFINKPEKNGTKDLTVRYYCDNLADSRRKYSDVNK